MVVGKTVVRPGQVDFHSLSPTGICIWEQSNFMIPNSNNLLTFPDSVILPYEIGLVTHWDICKDYLHSIYNHSDFQFSLNHITSAESLDIFKVTLDNYLN